MIHLDPSGGLVVLYVFGVVVLMHGDKVVARYLRLVSTLVQWIGGTVAGAA